MVCEYVHVHCTRLYYMYLHMHAHTCNQCTCYILFLRLPTLRYAHLHVLCYLVVCQLYLGALYGLVLFSSVYFWVCLHMLQARGLPLSSPTQTKMSFAMNLLLGAHLQSRPRLCRRQLTRNTRVQQVTLSLRVYCCALERRQTSAPHVLIAQNLTIEQ